MTLIETIQYLYDEEINVRIASFWDGGWVIELGDEINGFSHSVRFDNEFLEDASEWLLKTTKELYPKLPHG